MLPCTQLLLENGPNTSVAGLKAVAVAAEIPETARILNLAPHPEGGWFRRIYTSDVVLNIPDRGRELPIGSAIHFLLAAGETSRWHAIRSDELWFWHAGEPLEMFVNESGPAEGSDPIVVLGPNLRDGQRPQVLIPGGSWQSARPAGPGETLVSCFVCPSFHFDDFQLAPEPQTSAGR